jgi:hypothetical protein
MSIGPSALAKSVKNAKSRRGCGMIREGHLHCPGERLQSAVACCPQAASAARLSPDAAKPAVQRSRQSSPVGQRTSALQD